LLLARKAIKAIGRRERCIVDDYLHKISRNIVDQAKQNNAMIVMGDLKGIRKKIGGRWCNRKINSFPYHRLLHFIEYKAKWEGIAVMKVSEAYTSQICSCCGERGSRYNGKFVCEECGVELNADFNGAKNIMKRAFGYMSKVVAALTQPELGMMNPFREGKPRIPDF